MEGWATGYKVGYGEIAGIGLKNSTDIYPYIWQDVSSQQFDFFGTNWDVENRYKIQHISIDSDWVQYAYFPLYKEGQHSGWWGIDIQRGKNNRNEYYLNTRFCILDTAYNAVWTRGISTGDGVPESSRIGIFLSFYVGTKFDKRFFAIAINNQRSAIHQFQSRVMGLYFREDFSEFIVHGTPLITETVSSPEFGVASDVGGYGQSGMLGSFDDSSDTVTIPEKPTFSALSAGYFHAYYLNDPMSQLENIGDSLFPGEPTQQSDIISALGEIYQALFYNKQIDYIVDCHVVPVRPAYGSLTPIRVGGRILKTVIDDTIYNLSALPINDAYVDVDCGSVSIPEYWANFLDFSKGQTIKLFLPFVGFVSILNEYVISGELNIKYRFNVVDGSFMCFLIASSGKSNLDKSLIAQYSGSACLHIPLQSADYSRIIGGLVSTVAETTAGIATGNVALAGSGAVGILNNVMNSKPEMQSSNGYNASASFMSKRKPFLIIERSVAQFSEKYQDEIGLPLNVTKQLSSVSGFTICDNPVLSIDCTREEYDEIISLLKSGVIF